jgi:sortase A
MVLAGATGSAMAFGLGHVSGTALPGALDRIALAGHRDRWARFLRDLRVGDEVSLETIGRLDRYEVESLEVLPRDRVDLLEPTGPEPTLVLITCFPFDELLPSPRRWVVTCRLLPA